MRPVEPSKTEDQVKQAEAIGAGQESTGNEEKAKRRERRFHEAMTWCTGGLLLLDS
jgi:hypothetical protein